MNYELRKVMQSLSRAIRRGEAVLAFDSVQKRTEIHWRKGEDCRIRAWAAKNRSTETQSKYCDTITSPLTQAYIDNHAKDRHIFDN
jgi:hypothetical protein